MNLGEAILNLKQIGNQFASWYLVETNIESISKLHKKDGVYHVNIVTEADNQLIEKACKTYCRFCPHQCENFLHEDCQVQIDFRKIMEE